MEGGGEPTSWFPGTELGTLATHRLDLDNPWGSEEARQGFPMSGRGCLQATDRALRAK